MPCSREATTSDTSFIAIRLLSTIYTESSSDVGDHVCSPFFLESFTFYNLNLPEMR